MRNLYTASRRRRSCGFDCDGYVDSDHPAVSFNHRPSYMGGIVMPELDAMNLSRLKNRFRISMSSISSSARRIPVHRYIGFALLAIAFLHAFALGQAPVVSVVSPSSGS